MIPVSARIIKQNPAVVGEFMVTPSGEIQTHGYQRELFIALTFGDGSTPTYDVYANYVYDYHYNPTTKILAFHYDAIWYVTPYDPAWAAHPIWYSSQPTSGFAGNIELTYHDAIFSISNTGVGILSSFGQAEIHCTLQGFGDVSGQTLKLSSESTGVLAPLAGVDVIH